MITEPFQISVNGQQQFDILPETAKMLDIVLDNGGKFHLLLNGQPHRIELAEVNYTTRQFTFKIEGAKYTVKIADHYERLAQQLGLSTGGGPKTNVVKAPMPGLVLSILVEPGQLVQKGEPLLILEAMKMENVIKSVGDGRVKTIQAQKGMAVEKGHLLVEME